MAKQFAICGGKFLLAGGRMITVGTSKTYPIKSQLITMNLDGYYKTYRVLNISGSVAEVMSMTNSNSSMKFGSTQIYENSTVDTYLTSIYNGFTTAAKNAIVSKTFRQDSWYNDSTGSPSYKGYWYGNPGTKAYYVSLGNASFGNQITRNVYTMSIQMVLDYILDTTIGDGKFQNYNIWKLFWNIGYSPTTSNYYRIWLSSAMQALTTKVGRIFSNYGDIDATPIGDASYVRAVCTIDLNKIDFTINTNQEEGFFVPTVSNNINVTCKYETTNTNYIDNINEFNETGEVKTVINNLVTETDIPAGLDETDTLDSAVNKIETAMYDSNTYIYELTVEGKKAIDNNI